MAVQQLSAESLAEKIGVGVPGSLSATSGNASDNVLWVKPSSVADVAGFLKSDAGLDFNFLNSISAIDYINHFEVVYHLTSLNKQHSLQITSVYFFLINLHNTGWGSKQ